MLCLSISKNWQNIKGYLFLEVFCHPEGVKRPKDLGRFALLAETLHRVWGDRLSCLWRRRAQSIAQLPRAVFFAWGGVPEGDILVIFFIAR